MQTFCSPNQVPDKVECDPSAELEFTYSLETTKRPLVTVAHASGDRSEAGCLTLTKLYDWLATGPEDVPAVCVLCVRACGRACVCVCVFVCVCVCVSTYLISTTLTG